MPEQATMHELMTVVEVASYLRIKQRTIYELVRTGRIPFIKLSGKLLFPRRSIEQWIAQSSESRQVSLVPDTPPPVVAGSHDPLLEWALRESDCGLALLSCGSTDGLVRFNKGEAVACGTHLIDPLSGEYDAVAATKSVTDVDFVVIEWAKREQGLLVAPGNPKSVRSIKDLKSSKVRLARRQDGAGSSILMAKLLADAGLDIDKMPRAARPARTETDVAISIREGQADTGLAVRAAANIHGLDFESLAWERFDLVIRRRDYFEPPIQALLGFTRSPPFRAKAETLGGYDLGQSGVVQFNPRR